MSKEDYCLFVQWVIKVTVAELSTLVYLESDRKIHARRIAFHLVKLFSINFQGNDDALFGKCTGTGSTRRMIYEYSDQWITPKEKAGAKGKSKKRKVKEIKDDDLEEEKSPDQSRITNTLLHNVVQNVKKDILDKNLYIGVHIIEQSNRVCSSLHVLNNNEPLLLDDRSILLASLPISMQDFCESTCPGINVSTTDYAKYCDFYDHIQPPGDTERDDDADRLRLYFGCILGMLPSHEENSNSNPLLKPTFLGFNVTDRGKDVLSLQTPAFEFDDIWRNIAHGGGPFSDFLSGGLRVAMVMAVPFYFICTALQDGPGDINQVFGELPYSKMDEKSFDTMKYKELDLSKGKNSNSMMFLSNGSRQIESLSFNKLLIRFFEALVNDAVRGNDKLEEAAKDSKTEEEVKVSEAEKEEEDQLQQFSFGHLLKKAVDSIIFILDHKVLEVNTLLLLANCICCYH